MVKPRGWMLGVLMLVGLGGVRAGESSPAAVPSHLPVREVAVFKDGHAFVRCSGAMPTGPDGNVVLDDLPQAVFGMFWPYSSDPAARLAGAVAGRRDVPVRTPALSVRDLVRINVGARVLVTEHADPKSSYEAEILGPMRDPDGGKPPGPSGEWPKETTVVLLRTEAGVKALPPDQIRSVTFPDSYRDSVSGTEARSGLTLRLDWGGRPAGSRADVGLVYLQKGLRWIPEYKLAMDGQGNARVTFQATLINELTDLDDATVNLVVGVPSFLFKDTLDPMAMAKETPRLSQYFNPAEGVDGLSNDIVITQQMANPNLRRYSPPAGEPSGNGSVSLEDDGGGDLHLFTLSHISLRVGERMAVTVAEFAVKYEDVYTLDVPVVPPLELQRNLNSDRQLELARLLAEPRVKHRLNLVNGTDEPLTTAPAMVLRDGRLVSQGMMTYTPPGASCLLELTTAVNVRVQKSEEEIKRTPSALVWHGDSFDRIDLAGSVGLANFGQDPVEVTVTRRVLGLADSAGGGGRIQRLNALEELAVSGTGPGWGYPAWWAWLSWPYWWHHVNALGQVTWTVRLEPGKPVQLDYAWHYFWR